MRTLTAAGCLAIVAVAWLAGPGFSSVVPQPPASNLPALDYSLKGDSEPKPDVPKGTLTRHILAPGKFYPGTPHNYQIYVPAQHDASRPIAYMIFLDGSGYAGPNVRVPVVLDNLIATHDLPPMIAMFIDPGIMPALNSEA